MYNILPDKGFSRPADPRMTLPNGNSVNILPDKGFSYKTPVRRIIMKPPAYWTPDHQKKLDDIARVIYGEAAGEGATGMMGVANVLRNRALARGGGVSLENLHTIASEPNQFSAYGTALYNRAHSRAKSNVLENDALTTAKDLAKRLVDGEVFKDNTGGATHYLNPVTATDTSWISKYQPTVTLGKHKFFKNPNYGKESTRLKSGLSY